MEGMSGKYLISISCIQVMLIVLLCEGYSGQHNKYDNEKVSLLFIFGDSYLDSGNNNYINTTTLDKADFYPYGISFFHFPTGRFSNGRLISDFLAELANLPLIRPFLEENRKVNGGLNFASSGAGALVQTFQGSVINLHEQLRNYKVVEKWLKLRLGEDKARNKLRNAVYLFSIGSNDYITLFVNNSTPLLNTNYNIQSQYVNMVIANITSVIHEIYKIGGRKMVFLNLPPIGCFPAFRMRGKNGECFNEASSYIKLHNRALFQGLKKLVIRLPGFKYSLYDFYTSTLQRIRRPSKYGYKDGQIACCGTGKFRGVFSCGGKRPVKQYELCSNVDKYVFWDSFHFTEKVYKQIADDMWNSNNSDLHTYGSNTIKDLFFSFP